VGKAHHGEGWRGVRKVTREHWHYLFRAILDDPSGAIYKKRREAYVFPPKRCWLQNASKSGLKFLGGGCLEAVFVRQKASHCLSRSFLYNFSHVDKIPLGVSELTRRGCVTPITRYALPRTHAKDVFEQR